MVARQKLAVQVAADDRIGQDKAGNQVALVVVAVRRFSMLSLYSIVGLLYGGVGFRSKLHANWAIDLGSSLNDDTRC